MRVSRPAGDTGEADPAVTTVLAAYAAGQATELAVLTAIAGTRLLVPVVAVAADHAAADHATARDGAEMALPTLIGNDGRAAIIAFTGTGTLGRWRDDARPVPVPAARLWPAARAEHADAVVIDVAGPVPLVVEGARLAALARGEAPPAAHEDPDIRAEVAAVTGDFTLEPGGKDADLLITLHTSDLAVARAAAEQIAARLAPRLRRGIAVRAAGPGN